ncbi:MAG: cell division protein FtsQ/DivIB [Oxalobacter sp.]|jgi:cell division protein FtsQ|nr:cell division protein FtsQ/DivIB [Oxalobacter sp.]
MWNNVKLLRRLSNFFFCLFFVAVVVGVCAWLLKRPVYSLELVKVSSMDGKQLDHVSDMTIRNIAIPEIKGNFFTTDLEEVRRAFEAVPWVHKASVRREWPDKLVVALEEHKSLGTWGDEGRLLSTKGEVFTANMAEAEAGVDSNLKRFYGPDGSGREVLAQYREFLTRLAEVNLVPVEVRLSDLYSWSVRMDNGMLVVFGRDKEPRPLPMMVDRFLKIYPRLIQKFGNRIARIDMRYANGMAVRLKGAARAGGQDNESESEEGAQEEVQ